MTTLEDLKHLSAEFPKEDIHWRAQSMTQDGTKAMALAYLDARDVMDRLDQICGIDGWQDRYEFDGPRTICYISINVDGQWITKADGAGDTQVEAEKGSISGAFKRAAVKWGIGRYLYSLDAPWVPCESYERSGKLHWKKWKEDPWRHIKGASKGPSKADTRPIFAKLQSELRDLKTSKSVADWMNHPATVIMRNALSPDWADTIRDEATERFKELKASAGAENAGDVVADIINEYGGRVVNEHVEAAE